jgi:hypothetical protein
VSVQFVSKPVLSPALARLREWCVGHGTSLLGRQSRFSRVKRLQSLKEAMHICSRVQFVKVRQEFRIVKVGVVGILRGPALCVIAEVQAESRHNLLLPLVEDGHSLTHSQRERDTHTHAHARNFFFGQLWFFFPPSDSSFCCETQVIIRPFFFSSPPLFSAETVTSVYVRHVDSSTLTFQV